MESVLELLGYVNVLLAVLWIALLGAFATWLAARRPRFATAATALAGVVLVTAAWNPWLVSGLGIAALLAQPFVLLLAVGAAIATAITLAARGRVRDRAADAGPARAWLVAPLVLGAAVLLVDARLRDGLPRGARLRTFDAAAWQRGDPTLRFGMLHDLRDRVLPGLDRPAIEALLGAGEGSITRDSRTWILGSGHPEELIAIDPLVMTLEFDAAGRCAGFRVHGG